jgi:hypothetical protein
VSATTGNVGTGSAGTRTAGATPPTGPGAGGPAPEPRHLLSLRDLPTTEWNALLESAERLSGPDGRRPALAGRAIGGLFLDPSLRTRTSLEVACHDLGARLVSLDVGRAASLPWPTRPRTRATACCTRSRVRRACRS